ncbi:MAG: HIT family protein [Candidatus Hydrothermarchaeales archaeon]
MEECIFCKIVKGDIPSYKVYEDERTMAFLDINPISIGHTLVIPKSHVSKISELSDEDLLAFARTLQKITKAVESSVKLDGLNIFINQGKEAGQLIPHFHCHVTPRHKGDDVKIEVPAQRLKEEEFVEAMDRIKEAIASR